MNVFTGTSVVLDNQCGDDASLDLASNMDMFMSMMMDFSNKVNGLEQATLGPAAPALILSAVPLHDPKNTTQQATPSQDPELEEAVLRWVEQWLHLIHCISGG